MDTEKMANLVANGPQEPSEIDRRVAAIPQEHLDTIAEALETMAEESDTDPFGIGRAALKAAATTFKTFPQTLRELTEFKATGSGGSSENVA